VMVALLDVYCRRHKSANTVSRLQATCVALARMLKKIDAAEPVKQAQLAEKLLHAEISRCLSRDILNHQEASLLETLDWKITIPSTESWLTTYCTRFNLLTQKLLCSSVAWVWNETIANAVALLRHRPSSEKFPPRKQAIGLLGLAFVDAGLLPLHALGTKNLCPVLSQPLLLEIEGTKATDPKCQPLNSHSKRVLELLCMTVGTNLKNLKQDCKDAAVLLQCAKQRGAVTHNSV